MTSRRGFLGAIAAALVLDPERALWVPGKKLISIPAPKKIYDPVRMWVYWWDRGKLYRGNGIGVAELVTGPVSPLAAQLLGDRAEFDVRIDLAYPLLAGQLTREEFAERYPMPRAPMFERA